MTSQSLADLRRLFYGGGSDAEYQFLQGAVADGVTGAVLAGRGKVLSSDSIAVDSRYPHPLPEALVSGTFVAPPSGKVDIAVDLHGSNVGYAFANLGLVVGVPVNGKLRAAGQYAPLVPGAQRKIIGRGDYDSAVDITGLFRFEELVSGTTYQWQLESVIVGGFEAITTIASPSGVVFLESQKRGYIFSFDVGVSGITPFTMGGRPGWSDVHGPVTHALGAVIPHPAGPYGVYRPAITPDGSYAIAQALLSTGCVILNTATNAVQKVGNPASGGTSPYTAVCNSNAEAIVGFSAGTNRLAKITLATGVWGTAVNPGAGIIGMALDDTRTVLYAGRTDGVILRYPNLADLATGATFLDIGGRIECIAWGGDRVWVGLPNEIRSIHPTTFATIDSIATASTPNEIRLTPDFKVLWAMLQDGNAAYFPTAAHPDLVANSEFDSPDLGAGGTAIQLTSDGYIYALSDSKVNIWPGSTMGILAESGDGPGGLAPAFYDHGLEVKVLAA
jgi:hypothetical protein